MTEKEFEVKLKKIPFPDSRYKELGLSNDFIDKSRMRYSITQKPYKHNSMIEDPLVRLIQEYDLSKVEIGMITFNAKVYESDDYFIVGKFDIDSISISKITKEVVVISDEPGHREIYKCSQSGAKFLDSIITCAKFLENCVVDIKLYENQKMICSTSETCSEIAGGSKYLNFYKVLLGCNS